MTRKPSHSHIQIIQFPLLPPSLFRCWEAVLDGTTPPASALRPWPDNAYNIRVQDIPDFTRRPPATRRKRRERDLEEVSVPELGFTVSVPAAMVPVVDRPITAGPLRAGQAARQVIDLFLLLLYRGLVDGVSGQFLNSTALQPQVTMRLQDLRR